MTTPDVNLVEAFKAERAGYIARGLPERAALVDAELERLGVKVRPERVAAVAATRAADDSVETSDAAPASPVETAARPRPRKKP